MKGVFLITVVLFTCLRGIGQKVLADGSITYNVVVNSGKEEPGIADAFDGANLTVYMRGNQVRTDFKSILRQQTIFYDGSDGSAVQLKESGSEKYMVVFSREQWAQFNRKYEGITFTYTDDAKKVAGYNCKKAVGTLKDGSKIEVFYTPDLVARYPAYEYQFKDLKGFPLEYSVNTGKIIVTYVAAAVQAAPVNASRFDKPKSGYKVLEYTP